MTALTTQRYAHPKPKTTDHRSLRSQDIRAESATAERTGTSVVNPTRLIHFEHPLSERVAWCGAPVQGTYTPGKPAECSVCAALWEEMLS